MTGPASFRTRPPLRPLRGAEWFAARLALALRRTQRFVRWWIGLGGALTVVALLLPVAKGDSLAELREARDRAAADTLRAGARVRDLEARVASADSTLAAALAAASATPPRAARMSPTTGRADAPPAGAGAELRDPRLASLERALQAARRDSSVPMILALADEPLVRYGPRMRAFADSLRGTTEATEVRRLGLTIIAMAETRRAALDTQEGGTPVTESVSNRTTVPDETIAPVDTAEVRQSATALRDSLQRAREVAQVATDSVVALEQRVLAGRSAVPPVSPGLVLLPVLVLGVLVRVGSALMQEFREPTLAHSVEAERAVGAPALALVRDAIPDGPLRFRPSGVDPFRVLYLGLTSTGTRARSVIVTGEEIVIATAAAARLAIAAAADHRTTLVAELDPEQIALARLFRDRPEPGFTDALAGAFTWRDVARPVGSSDGLTIQMLPAGTARSLGEDQVTLAASRASFTEFRNGFEFTILVVSLHDLPSARELLPGAPLVLCGTIGETPVARFAKDGARLQEGGERLHSVVIWDAPRPMLPSRAELAALLSKRKGRTPGGSFQAVQEAIKKPV